MYRIPLAAALVAVTASTTLGQNSSARTVQYHSQDIVPIHAKLKYTTLIELPPTEKIMEAATGDKNFGSSMWSAIFVSSIRLRKESAPTST
jgi:type IV secretory pathway VirB9-like protein